VGLLVYTMQTDMDFLDPAKERRNRLFLFVGYALIALAIGIATLVLLYASYGYSVDREGQISQHGLVFVSSQPNGATITVDGKNLGRTNTKLELDAGDHDLTVSAEGYHDWARKVTVDGGDLQRFDYPFLIPKTLSTTTTDSYVASPLFVSQSPNKRLILLAESATPGQFTLLNIRDPQAITTTIVKPIEDGYTTGTGEQKWTPVEWADDNRHVLFEHAFTDGSSASKEFIILDVTKPEDTINATRTLGLDKAVVVSLFDKKSNQVYAYDPSAKTLRSYALGSQTPRTQLADIVAYKTYADDTVLYATTRPPSGKELPGQISVVLQQGSRSTTLRRYSAGEQTYLLDLARYDSEWYVVVGSSLDKGVYVYKNPQTQVLKTASFPLPWRFMRVNQPNYIGFSDNARFLLAENGQQIAFYDAEEVLTKSYSLTDTLDSPQAHVTWMDGHRLLFVSQGKLIMQDYDATNRRELGTVLAGYKPMFAPDYKTLFTISPLGNDSKPSLRLTNLVTKK
jgi:hypothetical protein